jgi:hypothetical protein
MCRACTTSPLFDTSKYPVDQITVLCMHGVVFVIFAIHGCLIICSDSQEICGNRLVLIKARCLLNTLYIHSTEFCSINGVGGSKPTWLPSSVSYNGRWVVISNDLLRLLCGRCVRRCLNLMLLKSHESLGKSHNTFLPLGSH